MAHIPAGRAARDTEAAPDPGAEAPPGARLDLTRIDTVLLDLDGTLLDLAFDNRFWLERIPAAYAAAHGLTLAQAREALTARFRACEGTLSWYCIEHWSRELALDVAALKLACAHEIAWLPGAREFLARLRAAGKRLILLTNAHPVTLEIKDRVTSVSAHVHEMISSHRLGVPKEDGRFWEAVRPLTGYTPERTLFVDDSPAVIRAAARAGISFVRAIRRPDSGGAPRDHGSFPAVDSVSELI